MDAWPSPAIVGGTLGASVSPTFVGAAVPLVTHTGRADTNAPPIGCALNDTAVVDAEHQRGTVGEFIAAPHARLSAAPEARHSASEPMWYVCAGQRSALSAPKAYGPAMHLHAAWMRGVPQSTLGGHLRRVAVGIRRATATYCPQCSVTEPRRGPAQECVTRSDRDHTPDK